MIHGRSFERIQPSFLAFLRFAYSLPPAHPRRRYIQRIARRPLTYRHHFHPRLNISWDLFARIYFPLSFSTSTKISDLFIYFHFFRRQIFHSRNKFLGRGKGGEGISYRRGEKPRNWCSCYEVDYNLEEFYCVSKREREKERKEIYL